jgi:hypothetical protein
MSGCVGAGCVLFYALVKYGSSTNFSSGIQELAISLCNLGHRGNVEPYSRKLASTPSVNLFIKSEFVSH